MIRLLTVIGHGTNLLPHFLNHYNYQCINEIDIVVYVSDISPNIENEVKDLIKNYEKVKIVKVVNDRVFDWEKVTQLYNEIKSNHPDDWWVIADIDEFHVYPYNSLYKVILECENHGWDIVRGGFIDRIGGYGEFSEINPVSNIFLQFPNAGFFRYPMSDACPNKICIMKGYVEITSGQHYAKIDGYTTWKWQGWNHPLIAPYDLLSVQVHHFKWDSTSIKRIKAVADIRQTYAYSMEYRKMYYALRENGFKIDVENKEYMFEISMSGRYNDYTQWNKLIKKIVSI